MSRPLRLLVGALVSWLDGPLDCFGWSVSVCHNFPQGAGIYTSMLLSENLFIPEWKLDNKVIDFSVLEQVIK